MIHRGIYTKGVERRTLDAIYGAVRAVEWGPVEARVFPDPTLREQLAPSAQKIFDDTTRAAAAVAQTGGSER
jgi:hypothetical protein